MICRISLDGEAMTSTFKIIPAFGTELQGKMNDIFMTTNGLQNEQVYFKQIFDISNNPKRGLIFHKPFFVACRTQLSWQLCFLEDLHF